MSYIERATERLHLQPMTRLELETFLGTTQQNASMILKKLGAIATKSRPPRYSLGEISKTSVSFAGVSSVFQLGDRAMETINT